MLLQPGLKWELNKYYEAEPTWTHDPNVKIIVKLARKHLHFSQDDKCTADYFMQGAFNRVYLVRCPRGGNDERSFIFRVSLPVDPGFKVGSDVATMTFMREHTNAPVPLVLAFDPSHENELGFAWTIMEMMPGQPLCHRYRDMTRKQKEDLAKRVADIVAQMFRHKFHGIGNLYQAADASPQPTDRNITGQTPHLVRNARADVAGDALSPSSDRASKKPQSTRYRIGRIVQMSFLWHNRVHYDICRGPFACSQDWLAARLAFVIADSIAIQKNPVLGQQQKVLASTYALTARRLQKQLPNFFPTKDSYPSQVTPEITTLHHYDMSGYNVLVDGEGKLTALLDWDGVSAVPLWKACQMPEFLVSRYIDEMGDDSPKRMDKEYRVSQTAKDRAVSLEKAQLRDLFLTEMKKLEPRWVEVYKDSGRLADFEAAVQLCDSRSNTNTVGEWLRDIEQGREYWSLQRHLLGE